MPRIDTNTRRITTAPIQGAPQQEVSPDAFGAGLGEQIQRTAGIIHQMQGQEWDRANQFKVDDASLQVTSKRLELTSRLRQAKGDQALAPDFASGLESELQDTIRTARSGLVNPAQTDAFERNAQQTELSFRDVVNNHISDQAEIAAQEKSNALVMTNQQNAVANRNDEGLLWRDLLNAENTRAAYLQSRGVPKEAIAAEVDGLRGKTLADAVEAMADDGNHLGAKRLLDASLKYIKNPADLKRAEAATKAASTRGESQRLVDGIMARPDSSIATAMAEAAKIADPELRAAVEQRAVTMLGLREKAKDEAQTNAFADAYKLAKDDPRGIDAVPLSVLQSLEPARRQQLEAWAKREARGEPLPWQASKAVRYQIEAEAATPEGRQRFVDTDLRKLLGRVNEDDFNALSSLQQEIRKGGASGQDAAWLTTREDVVNEALAGLKIDPRPYTVKQDGTTKPNEKALDFRRQVEQEAAAVAGANKRQKPTVDDVRKAVDTVMLRKVRLNEWGRDPEVGAYALEKDDADKAYVPIDQIEPGRVDAIRELIRRYGGTVSDDRIEKAYAAYVRTDDKALRAILSGKD